MAGQFCFAVLCACFLTYICSMAESKQIYHEIKHCKVDDKLYSIGEKFSLPGVCAQFTCLEGGEHSGVSCPLQFFPKNSKCYLEEEDASKGWPDCCGNAVCSEDEKIMISLASEN